MRRRRGTGFLASRAFEMSGLQSAFETRAAEGQRRLGDVEVEPCVFCMEVFFIRRNFTERARRLNSRNAGIAARVFAPTISAP
jgi:hypothetical protein